MKRVRVTAAAAVVLVLAGGCRDTQWPSRADRAEFCDVVTGPGFDEDRFDDRLVHLGTPQDLPYEARRYLLDLADGHDPVPAEQQVFETYVADHC